MSDKDISQMEVKELRKEVQELRDALAIMQRKYEDLFYNLDTENFSGNFLNGINSKASSDEVESMISQTASEINTRISGVSGSVSSLKQTVNSFKAKIIGEKGTSIFTQTDDGFELDGNKTVINSVIYLTNNDGDRVFSFFVDENYGTQLIMHNTTNKNYPIILGDGEGVYISSSSSDNKVATQGWVKENCTATFG